MKIVVLVGKTENSKGLAKSISKAIGYDSYNTDDELSKTLGSDMPPVDALGMNTFITEELLLNRILENSIRGRWGITVTGTMTFNCAAMLRLLGAVFVLSDTDISDSDKALYEETLNIQPLHYTGENTVEFIRGNLRELPEVFKGIKTKTAFEVVGEYKKVISILEDGAVKVSNEWARLI